MVSYSYTVQIEPAEEGGFLASVPFLHGMATQGETFEEAREMARDLIAAYLEYLTLHDVPIPVETDDRLLTRVTVSCGGSVIA